MNRNFSPHTQRKSLQSLLGFILTLTLLLGFATPAMSSPRENAPN